MLVLKGQDLLLDHSSQCPLHCNSWFEAANQYSCFPEDKALFCAMEGFYIIQICYTAHKHSLTQKAKQRKSLHVLWWPFVVAHLRATFKFIVWDWHLISRALCQEMKHSRATKQSHISNLCTIQLHVPIITAVWNFFWNFAMPLRAVLGCTSRV